MPRCASSSLPVAIMCPTASIHLLATRSWAAPSTTLAQRTQLCVLHRERVDVRDVLVRDHEQVRGGARVVVHHAEHARVLQ